MRFPDQVCKIDMQDAQGKASKTIGEYGATKFVVDTHNNLSALEATYNTEMNTLGKKEMELRNAMSTHMSVDESVKYFSEKNASCVPATLLSSSGRFLSRSMKASAIASVLSLTFGARF